MKKLFEKAFVGKGGKVVCRTNLVKDRHRNAPRHPLARHVRKIPTPAQECFDNLYFSFRQTIQTGSEVNRFEGSTKCGITDRRRKNLREGRSFCLSLTDDNSPGHHVAYALISRGGEDLSLIHISEPTRLLSSSY